MKIIKNSIGWEDEDGIQLAFNKDYAFMNTGRHPKHQRPIWKEEDIKKQEVKK